MECKVDGCRMQRLSNTQYCWAHQDHGNFASPVALPSGGKICGLPDCGDKHYSRGCCYKHYMSHYRKEKRDAEKAVAQRQ